MEFTPDQVKSLTAKLDASNVKERTQAGRKLSYIEGWHAIAEANRIFGHGKWNRETLSLKVVAEKSRKIGVGTNNERDGWGVTYVSTVRVTVGDVIRDGTGSGHGIDVDLGLAHESAIKEAETDAMKRALMTFGNPFGLALYDKTQADVEKPERPAAKPEPKQEPKKANGKEKPAWVSRLESRIAKAVDTAELETLLAEDYAKDLATTTQSGRSYIDKLVASRRVDLSSNPFG